MAVSECVLRAVADGAECGWLVGASGQPAASLRCGARCSDRSTPNHSELWTTIPGGVSVMGAWVAVSGSDPSQVEVQVQQFVQKLLKGNSAALFEDAGDSLCVAGVIASLSEVHYFSYNKSSQKMTPAVGTQPGSVVDTVALLRIHCWLDLTVAKETSAQDLAQHCKGLLKGKLGTGVPHLWLAEAGKLVALDGSGLVTAELPKGSSASDAVDAEVVFSTSASEQGPQPGPTFDFVPGNVEQLSISVHLDAVALVFEQQTLAALGSAVRRALSAQLETMAQALAATKQDGEILVPCAQHFKPRGLSIPVTVVFPFSKEPELADDDYVKLRTDTHRRLGLEADRPMFRFSNALFRQAARPDRLRNPHLTLGPSGVDGGTQCLVDGDYDYYHYMQDKFDDKNWGCAYRSLQSIISWYRLQGYTAKPIPTHTQIQQFLVDRGDKPKTFAGSKQWIGSIEMAYCLKDLFEDEFEFEYKVLPQIMGGDLPLKARELIRHFQTNGSPVMIGGNDLAHTILGVDFNESLGTVKWLVLDPHYIGPDELKNVQGKWCGWKGPDFWNPNTTYNLMLPARPTAI